jgi:hypothetical protein
VKSALETHLQQKHGDQSKSIDIDLIPEEPVTDSASSPCETKVPINYGANNSTNSLGAAPTSPSSNIMTPFLQSISAHAELEQLYAESLKRYAQEVQQTSQNGGTPNNEMQRFIKSEPGNPTTTTGDSPLDLSKPVDLTRALGKTEPMDTSFLDQDYLSGESDDESLC